MAISHLLQKTVVRRLNFLDSSHRSRLARVLSSSNYRAKEGKTFVKSVSGDLLGSL